MQNSININYEQEIWKYYLWKTNFLLNCLPLCSTWAAYLSVAHELLTSLCIASEVTPDF
jgi:hypothetical protein